LRQMRVAKCTAYRVIAGGSGRPRTSVQNAEASELKPAWKEKKKGELEDAVVVCLRDSKRGCLDRRSTGMK
jgi:hypothetical protein